MTGRVVVVGVGNPFRRDDGAGPAVLIRLQDRVPEETSLAVSDGEPEHMTALWDSDDHVVVVESVHAHPPRPGRIHQMCVQGRNAALDALRLGCVLDPMPRQLVVLAVEGGDFGWGTGCTEEVERVLPELTSRVADAVRNAWRGLRGGDPAPAVG